MGLTEFLPSEYLEGTSEDQLELMDPCPRVLSTVADGTWADSRALPWRDSVHEFHRKYVPREERNKSEYPYQLGGLCMDDKLLRLMKDALAMLKPDGF